MGPRVPSFTNDAVKKKFLPVTTNTQISEDLLLPASVKDDTAVGGLAVPDAMRKASVKALTIMS